MATNPRLVELQRIYRGMNEHPVRKSSLWTEDFTRQINLLRFRSHNAYLWQEALTPASSCIGCWWATIRRRSIGWDCWIA